MLAKKSRVALLIFLHLRGTVGQLLCSNTCNWASDGTCDDGGPGGYPYGWCSYGTDCVDCGPRPPRPPPPPPPPSPPPYPPFVGLEGLGKAVGQVVGTIVGVAVGVGVGLGLCLCLCLYCCCCRKKARAGTPPLQRPTTEAHEPQPAVATKTNLTTRANLNLMSA
jgi:hypothetical protein